MSSSLLNVRIEGRNRYDGLWVEICLEIMLVVFGILSVFGQPGESVRSMFIALAALPSLTYIINTTRFLENWNSQGGTESPDGRWEIRFSASGLVILSTVNYLWMFAWGWGPSECIDARTRKPAMNSIDISVLTRSRCSVPGIMNGQPGLTRRLLKTMRSFTTARGRGRTHDESEGLELGRVNGQAAL